MTILGVDPGNTHSAAVMLENGRIVRMFRERNDEFLKSLQRIDAEFRNQGYLSRELRVVCEMVACYGMTAGATLFDTCVQIGRCQAIFPDMDLVTRIQVKTELCRSARAKDANVRQALIDIYGAPGTRRSPGGTYGLKSDMWSALAVCTAAVRGCQLYSPTK